MKNGRALCCVLGCLVLISGCGASSQASAHPTSGGAPSRAPSWHSLSADEICERVAPVITAESLGSTIEDGPVPSDDGGGLRHCVIDSAMLSSPDGATEYRSGYAVYVSDPETSYFKSQTLPQIALDESLARKDDVWPAQCGEGYVVFDQKREGYRVLGSFCKDGEASMVSARAWLISAPDYIQLSVNRPTWIGDYSSRDFLHMVDKVLTTN